MTFSEYRAWVEGLIEGIGGGTPNAEQWEKIKTKLLSVEGPPRLPGPTIGPVISPPHNPSLSESWKITC